ncbi:MAG: hypothetical protein E7052_07420 [Lentisphaerae bacterium]|nr:hypothetical protein [Lentisphaerota bacterium]
MSKIDDILQELRNYLSSCDHSDSPHSRKLLAAYAEVCNTVNAQLQKCQELMSRGLLPDARKLCNEMTPSLTERVARLTLPEHLHAEYIKICQLYNCPQAAEFDLSIVEKLQDPNLGNRLSSLIMRWRKIARRRNNRDKLNLLREIIACSPENDQIWRSNLHSVEQMYLSELLLEAEKALQNNQGAELVKLYVALTDPLLQTQLPHSKLVQFEQPVRQQQLLELQNQLAAKRLQLFNAYSAMDAEAVAKELQEYDILITHPLYQADDAAESSVNEVRSYLQLHQENERKEKLFAQKRTELISALNDHADYPRIENIFETLRQLDLPLEENLCQRVANRRSEYLLESRLRHQRKCIYGVIAAVLLLAVFFLLFKVIEQTRSFFGYQEAMQKLLQSQNYDGVLKLRNEIASQTPLLLRFGNLEAMAMEANKQLKQQQEIQTKINDLLQLAENEVQRKILNLSEMQHLNQLMLPQIDHMTAEQSSRYQRFAMALRQHESRRQNQLDQQFTADLDKIIKQLQKFEDLQFSTQREYQSILQQVNELHQQGESLGQQARQVTPALRDGRLKLLQMRCQAIKKRLESCNQRIKLLEELNRPVSFIKYCATLASLPENAPDLAAGTWRKALQNLPQAQALAAAIEIPSYLSSHKELENFMLRQPFNMQNTPAVQDALRLMPDKYFLDKYRQQLDKLINELKIAFDCYELVFSDIEGTIWRFYSSEQPILDKGMNSRIPKAIAMSVILSPGEEGKFLPIKIARANDNKFFFYPGRIAELALPAAFTKLHNMPLTSSRAPKSQHGKLLDEAIFEIKKADTPKRLENVIFTLLDKLKKADSMNVLSRALLTRKLLDFLPAISSLYTPMVNFYSVELDNIAINMYDKWYLPTLEIEHPHLLKKLQEFFRNFDPATISENKNLARRFHQLALERALTPGGIILPDNQQKYRLHNFAAMDNIDEIWIFTPPDRSGRQGWIVENRTTLLQRKNLTCGTVFFVPLDTRKTSELAQKIHQEITKRQLNAPIWPASWPLNVR